VLPVTLAVLAEVTAASGDGGGRGSLEERVLLAASCHRFSAFFGAA